MYRFSDKIMRQEDNRRERQPFQREEHGVRSIDARPAGRGRPDRRVVERPRPERADFYKGKTVDLYIGYSVGGGYDLYARMLAR